MNMKKFFPMMVLAMVGLNMLACSDDESSVLQPQNPQPLSSDAAVPVDFQSSDAVIPGAESSASVVPGAESSASVVPGIESSASVVPGIESSAAVAPGIESSASVAPVNPNATYSYYGTELTGLDQYTYGRFEARMKMLSFPGSVSSMFLYYDPSYLLGDEPWNEIDIEVLGKTDTIWQANLITREPDVDKKNVKITSETKPEFGFHASEEFHLYGIVWTPEYIAWEIDSVEIRRDVIGNPDNRKHDQVAFMNQQQSLRFNVWISGSTGWVGKFTGDELAAGPRIQYIDYVRTYKYDVATKTFTLDWQDDFNGDDLDPKHWSRGNWEMEKVMYREENLVVKDGMVQMILDREED